MRVLIVVARRFSSTSPTVRPAATAAAARRFTPKTLREVFQKSIEVVPAVDHDPNMVLGGILSKVGKRPYQVSGSPFWYDRLVDPFEADIGITVRLPDLMRQSLPNGHSCVFRGYLNRKAMENCTLQLIFEVTQIEHQSAPQTLTEKERRTIDVLRKSTQRRRANVDLTLRTALHEGRKPTVTMITGENSIVDQDVIKALEPCQMHFTLDFVRVNMQDPEQIANAMRSADADDVKDHVVCIVRGGGSGLNAFDDVDLAEAALQINSPLVAAIGHAEDAVLLGQVCDRVLTTPTALGVYLKETARQCLEQRDHCAVLQRQRVEEEFAERLTLQSRTCEELRAQLASVKQEKAQSDESAEKRLAQRAAESADQIRILREQVQQERKERLESERILREHNEKLAASGAMALAAATEEKARVEETAEKRLNDRAAETAEQIRVLREQVQQEKKARLDSERVFRENSEQLVSSHDLVVAALSKQLEAAEAGLSQDKAFLNALRSELYAVKEESRRSDATLRETLRQQRMISSALACTTVASLLFALIVR
ncbi:unnamed protein product (mitochondrion) [Plasmodiophora brassicae]|uniref:Exonuclease VII large subunit C-terminal domain-containing protein n=1 Tax=Plasmodiophora brassicae TaxID=37360 RepID=A0A0G4IU16_PLABS|nr:hypothetical protein PBRA_006738 [Plasmodiophora brassicae]SPR00758.1 unnamed protein product [Plasmodiophora brassicae]